MVKLKKFCGVIPPAITIFDEDGRVDIDANKKLADFLIAKGVAGIAYLGTSGEFSVMDMEQKLGFIYEMTQYVDKRVDVLIGVGDTCLANTLKLVDAVEQAGADGVLAVTPYFSVYSEDLIEAYYNALAEATNLPIIIYNFPDLTGFDMNLNLVKRLADRHHSIVGIKDTVEDYNHLVQMLSVKKINPNFSVFCAYETQALDMLIFGADGFINATSNFAPEYTVGIYREMKAGNFEKSVQYFKKMYNASQIYQYSEPLFLAVKEAVYQRVLGRNGFEKLPALPLNNEAKDQIKQELKAMGLL